MDRMPDHELPDIINTPVIPGTYDAFWEELPEAILALPPKQTLVLSRPYDKTGEEAVLVTRILQACKLTEDDYSMVFISETDRIAWHKLREHFNPRNVISFGIDPDQLGISFMFMPHQVTNFNGVAWIPSFPAAQLEKYPDAKKHLWTYGLKPVFVDRIYDK